MRAAAVCIAFVLTSCTSESLIAGTRYVDQQPASNGDVDRDKRVDLTEPSCDELRAMWRYTKRQSRAAKTTNGYPMYPAFYPNVWHGVAFPDRTKFSMGYRGRQIGRARSRAAGGAPIYGRMVHKAPAGSRWRSAMRGPSRARAFEEFSRHYGTVNHFTPNEHRITSFRVGGGGISPPPKSQVPQSGSFEALKNLIQAERARELQEQHVAEKMEAEIAGKQRTDEKQGEYAQHSRKHFFDPSSVYEITPKVNYDKNQRRYSAANIPNFGMAWSRSGPIPREHASP